MEIKTIPEIEELRDLFAAYNFDFFLVGGSVRDALLNKESKDIDIATNASPTEILHVLENTKFPEPYRQGEKFGTIGIPLKQSVEITTFRTDSYDPETRKPTVEFGTSLIDDLSRRDFTINAMAYDFHTKKLVDPFNGQNDLSNRILRTPLSPEISFSDDPLRMMRAARFIARFDLLPDLEVIESAYDLRKRMSIISRERINDELCKILVAPYTNEAFTFMHLIGLLDQIFPSEMVNNIEFYTPPVLIPRLCELFRSLKHYSDIKQTLVDLKFSNSIISDVLSIMEIAGPPTKHPKEHFRRAAIELKTQEKFKQMIIVNDAYRQHQSDMYLHDFEELLEEEDIFDIEIPVTGQDIMEHIGIPPGPLVGFFQRVVIDERLEKGPLTRKQAFDVIDIAANRWFMKDY